MNLLAARRFLRVTSFDTTTESGRADERYRLAVWSTLANLASKGLAMVVLLLGVSRTVPYLGAERFGMWTTVASFAGMLAFLDLGVGTALTNHIATAAATSRIPDLRQAITGGIGFLAIIGTAAT